MTDFPKPGMAKLNKDRGTTFLTFTDQEFNGEYAFKGAICWPVTTELFGETAVYGFVLMAGQNLRTKIVYIFEDRVFSTVGSAIAPGNVFLPGIESFFNRCWTRYYATNFYFGGQPAQTAQKYRLQVSRNEMVQPKPSFIEIEGFEPEQALTTALQNNRAGTLRARPGGDLQKQIGFVQMRDKAMVPGLHALECVSAAYEQYPWREPWKKGR